MTIKAFLDKLETARLHPVEPDQPSFTDTMEEITEIWNNNAAMGYFIHAAELVELDQDTTRKILKTFHQAFNELTVDEAERKYISF